MRAALSKHYETDVLKMVNPLLTVIFDLFLIGSAVAIVTGMVLEFRASKGVSVGTTQSAYRARHARTTVMSRRTRRNQRLRAA